MPLIRYIFQHPEGHTLTEEDVFPSSDNDFETVRKIVITQLQKTEPGIRLLSVEIRNPLIHTHQWERSSRMGDRVFYSCSRCQAVSYRRFNNFQGEVGMYVREGKWKSVKYDHCHTPLKAMPVSTSLFT